MRRGGWISFWLRLKNWCDSRIEGARGRCLLVSSPTCATASYHVQEHSSSQHSTNEMVWSEGGIHNGGRGTAVCIRKGAYLVSSWDLSFDCMLTSIRSIMCICETVVIWTLLSTKIAPFIFAVMCTQDVVGAHRGKTNASKSLIKCCQQQTNLHWVVTLRSIMCIQAWLNPAATATKVLFCKYDCM